MESKHTSRKLLSIMILFLFVSTLIMPVYANGLESTEYWDDAAQQITNSIGGVVNAEDLAKRLSVTAGKSQYSKDGVKKYTVVVTDGTNYYAGGQKIDPVSIGPSGVDYKEVNVSNMVSNQNTAVTGVKVGILADADETARSRVRANLSAGLLSQSNVTPDTGTAMGLLSGVMPMINTLLGLMVVVISVGMTVFSALDIIYLAFPAFRALVDDQVENGGKHTKMNKDGSTSSKWVTDDAMLANKEAMSSSKSPWGGYFRRRVLAYIFLAIILFILLTGNIFAITTLVTNALQGLFQSLGL